MMDIAQDYIAAGICVIPLRLDGSKSPACPAWKQYQDQMPTRGKLISWFSRPCGIGIVCGAISGGLEVFDFDQNPVETFNAWKSFLPAEIRGRLTVIETAGGGFHVPFRCDAVCKNSKIAMPADGLKPFIETRGEGGYVVAVGSPLEVHSSGNPYVQVAGETLPAIPTFTRDERKRLWEVARQFDQRDRRDVVSSYVPKRRSVPADLDTEKPWDDFDVRADWSAILTPHGWQSYDGEHWIRPGKDTPGTSAKVVDAQNGCEVLTVFSSSAGVLSASTGDHATWGKFSAFVALNHEGDRKAGARAARLAGYGGKSR